MKTEIEEVIKKLEHQDSILGHSVAYDGSSESIKETRELQSKLREAINILESGKWW